MLQGKRIVAFVVGGGDPERLLFATNINKGDTHTHVAGEAHCGLCGGGGDPERDEGGPQAQRQTGARSLDRQHILRYTHHLPEELAGSSSFLLCSNIHLCFLLECNATCM